MPCEKNEQGKILLQIARAAISRTLHISCAPAVVDENIVSKWRETDYSEEYVHG